MRVQVSQFARPGAVVIMVDYSHPETPMHDFGIDARGQITAKPAEIPDGRVLLCHPDDEQHVRDALAIAQERPKWWEDMRAFHRLLASLDPPGEGQKHEREDDRG